MQTITSDTHQFLHGITQTRQIEQLAAAQLPPHALMQRAGLAVARLALALAPHAQHIWVACGPGNNGGDGLEAALHLSRWGKQPVVTWLGHPDRVPADTAAAYQRALAAKILFSAEPIGEFDLCIDALLGIGTQLREPHQRMANWITRLNTSAVPVLAIDVPSGLHADTGQTTALHVQASHTLSLLTLKPGLFTAHGRDAAGTVWLDTLGVDPAGLNSVPPIARLPGRAGQITRPHASHKGTFGDVAVVGGAPGMTGAALLAASAALHAGAGRVFVALLDDNAITVDTQQPELMFRPVQALDLAAMTVVCGCGGGTAVSACLPQILATSSRVVLDADAINTIAKETTLQAALLDRHTRQTVTVLTPHPLEAARLLGVTTAQIQGDRLTAAQTLSQRFACTVVLKGSGTVIAAPGQLPVINPTGNARLATAGTGDVLAGMVGARLATGLSAFDAACQAVYNHGQRADDWPASQVLTASRLASSTPPAP
ncbi:NAD(P)H-hydrate dehydratase [Rhodoferax sp.]|uniref:NAD(P)H-hydrate dehydratase n=1 Tax=Rhodoferax sp. TaxID=50421 RepID=UPI00261EB437|nr:NAD(P)H-hydrate dehydratase [Rhodoferax sp.]MDD2925517.1 NAD(P)H-hydrate dehydratase [Rhodoferax sp.]